MVKAINYAMIISAVSLGVTMAVSGQSVHAMTTIATPQLSPLANYRDWVVGCDNIFTCQAVSLQDDFARENAATVSIKRTASPQPQLTIEIDNIAQISDRYRIIIDGKNVDTGVIDSDRNMIIVTSADALKLARAMARGYAMEIFDGTNQSLGKISLSGSFAALRYMDDRQNMMRTPMGISSVGRQKYRSKNIAAPIIAVQKIAQTGIIPAFADILRLSKISGCEEEQFGVTEDRAYSLGNQDGNPLALAIISCGSGAYNYSSAPFVGVQRGGAWQFVPAKFDYDKAVFTSENGAKILVNVGWDEERQILSSYYKGRGIGDCGSSADYVWDGNMFRLVSANSMDPCRGSINWISLWQAQPFETSDATPAVAPKSDGPKTR